MTERTYLSIHCLFSYGPSKMSTFGYSWRQKTELTGSILAINMLHCLVTKHKLAGVPVGLPELRCYQTGFLFAVAYNNCTITLSKRLSVVELLIFKQADHSW